MSFQNAGVNNRRTVMISRRPMSISTEVIHLTTSGRMFHDITGPISVPSVGPTLLTQLRAMVMALVLSTPTEIIIVADTTLISTNTERNDSSDGNLD